MQPHELLKEIMANNGLKLCSNRPRCKAIISDTFKNSHGREKNILYIVLDEGIIDELINNSNNIKLNAPRFINKLVKEYGIQKILARWAVCAWAYSLGATIDVELLQIEEKLPEINKHHQIEKKSVTNSIPIWNESIDAWFNKGNELYNLCRYQEAIDAYNKALAIDPNYKEAWCLNGIALHKLSRYQEAISAYNKAIAIDPNFANAWCSKGYSLVDLGKYQEAVDACNKAIYIDPMLKEAWNIKGIALKKLGRYREAIDAFNKALNIDQNFQAALKNKQNLLSKMRK